MRRTFAAGVLSAIKRGTWLIGVNKEAGWQQKLAEKNQRLARFRGRLEDKDRELTELKAKLARTQVQPDGPGLSADNTPVFFVVGRAKSGTSWLMRTLNEHPEILCTGEGRFFGRNFIQKDLGKARRGKVQPSSLHRAILEAEYLKGWIEKSVWTRNDDADEHLERLTYLMTNYFLTRRLEKSDKRIVGDKTPFLDANTVRDLGRIYPEARMIHVIRDGRDVAVSFNHHRWNNARHEGGIYDLSADELASREAYRKDPREFAESGSRLFAEGTVRKMAAEWKNQVTRARQDGPALMGENYTEVRYEDLLEDPEKEIGRILGFLGADAGEQALAMSIEAGSFERWTKGRERGQEDSASFFRKGVAGDWEGVFTEEDKRVFKEVAGDLLVELGYEEDDNW